MNQCLPKGKGIIAFYGIVSSSNGKVKASDTYLVVKANHLIL